MFDATTRSTSADAVLHVGIEIGDRQWKLASTVGLGQAPRSRTIPAGDMALFAEEVERAKRRFGIRPDGPVISCYEAGRCGFWPHRALEKAGISNRVVDSSSIEVNRRQRRAKTDRLDAAKLSEMLTRYALGQTRIWSVVHVPSVEAEDLRQYQRAVITVTRERARTITRIKGLLAAQGAGWDEDTDRIHCWDESPLPGGLRLRVGMEVNRLCLIERQVVQLRRERCKMERLLSERQKRQLRDLMQLNAIGPETAWLLVLELFGWRTFRNVKQLGAIAGLAPTPYQSGDSRRELGISKSGNRLIRWIMIEAAWRWLRYQPESAISRWYEERFAHGGGRMRRIGITAVARRLLCALWKYVDQGTLPEGAVLKR